MDRLLTFNDIINTSIVKMQLYNKLTIGDTLLVLLWSSLLCGLVFYIYKKTYKGVLYTYNFNIALFMIGLVTAMMIMTISSNLVLSLGMVGALSIVRFRSAIKEPLDIVFIFWSIAIGITCGASLFQVAAICSIFIATTLLLLSNIKSKTSPYLLVVNGSKYNQNDLFAILKQIKKYKIKSKSVSQNSTELTIEVRFGKDKTNFVDQINKINGVKDTILISYNGDYVS